MHLTMSFEHEKKKSQIVNLAQAYQEDQIPRARGDAARVLQASEAFKQERIADATGQGKKFLKVLEEYEKAPDITRQRLYLESMEKILPGVTKYIISESVGGNMLQFLPLDGSTRTITDPQGGQK
jgi:membrane protease subunit HflK